MECVLILFLSLKRNSNEWTSAFYFYYYSPIYPFLDALIKIYFILVQNNKKVYSLKQESFFEKNEMIEIMMLTKILLYSIYSKPYSKFRMVNTLKKKRSATINNN
jgi:hypothetical protein